MSKGGKSQFSRTNLNLHIGKVRFRLLGRKQIICEWQVSGFPCQLVEMVRYLQKPATKFAQTLAVPEPNCLYNKYKGQPT